MKVLFKVFIMIHFCLFLSHYIQIDFSSFPSYCIAFQQVDFKSNNTTLLVHNPLPVLEEPLEIEKKKIYIYNTHQQEQYQTNSVMDGARYLKSKLESKGYIVYFEESDFNQYKRDNNMDLTETYPTSRIFLENNISQYGPFDLIIDFHRDALNRENSFCTINDIDYARLMCVIGNDSDLRETVKRNSQIIHHAVDEILPGIMRSDFFRDDALYNQDVARKMLLIEVGGNTNTFEEVCHSLDILASAIDICLREERFE